MITICIPLFNQQDYVCDAIESAMVQAGVSQIIVVNDGSTDNSLEIAKRYEQYGVKVVNQVNKGLASARNTGIMNARSEYVLFLDSDDILLEDCTAKIIEYSANTRSDIIAPSFKEFGISNAEVVLMDNPTLEDFKTGNRIGYCAAIRRMALQECGGYNPRMVEGYEDLALWCDLLSRGSKIVTIPEVLWLYRTKKESMYTKITPQIHEKLIQQINADIPTAELAF